jgi:hypothetical protein
MPIKMQKTGQIMLKRFLLIVLLFNCSSSLFAENCNYHFIHVKNNSSKTWWVTRKQINHGEMSLIFPIRYPGESWDVEAKSIEDGVYGPDVEFSISDGPKTYKVKVQQNLCFWKAGQIHASSDSPVVHLYDVTGNYWHAKGGHSYFEIRDI